MYVALGEGAGEAGRPCPQALDGAQDAERAGDEGRPAGACDGIRQARQAEDAGHTHAGGED